MKVRVTRGKRGKYDATFTNKDKNIVSINKKLTALELVELSKQTINKDD